MNLTKFNILVSKNRCLHSLVRGFLSRTVRRKKFGNYDIVVPGEVSPMQKVPDNIDVPPYYKTCVPLPPPLKPDIKNEDQIRRMRKSCQLAREVLDSLHSVLKIGMTTDEIDEFAHHLIISRGAYPSPLNYKRFPKSICTSVNNVVCHGIPDNRPLQDGDIVNVDVTVFYEGFHGDCSNMYLIGQVDEQGRELCRVTLETLNKAIECCKPGEPLCSIGNTIEEIATENNLSVVAAFAGHGIGSYFHGPPDINHYANNEEGKMLSGMTFTIEPILSQGAPDMVILDDQWTAVTVDGSRSAQWEHTILITKTGVEVLTGPDYHL